MEHPKRGAPVGESPSREQVLRAKAVAGAEMAGPLVSMVVPCYNGEAYLADCLQSVLMQTYRPLELSFWNDASSDGSLAVLEGLRAQFDAKGIHVKIGQTLTETPGGAGHAKGQAVQQSTGEYLCFLDCDDVCLPERVQRQLQVAIENPTVLVGCNFVRDPETATPQYASWVNGMTDAQLHAERFCECTIIMPTWFCHREVISAAGGLSTKGHAGTMEDLLFFHEHLNLGREVRKVPEVLLVYRQHPGQISVSSVPFAEVWALRVQFLISNLLSGVSQFAICSAGRDGKRLYRQLPSEVRRKCVCFVEDDVNKLASATAGLVDKELERHVPVVPYSAELPRPLVVCWKRGFDVKSEISLAKFDFVSGQDYYHFFRTFA